MAGGDETKISQSEVEYVAQTLPVSQCGSAAANATGLPTGVLLFGLSDVGKDLTSVWNVTAGYFANVTAQLEESMVDLRRQLLTAVENVSEGEADAARRFALLAQEHATTLGEGASRFLDPEDAQQVETILQNHQGTADEVEASDAAESESTTTDTQGGEDAFG